MTVLGFKALVSHIQERHEALRWLYRDADDGIRKLWVVDWIAGGQTVAWTSSSSPWHFLSAIPQAVVKDWMRRWWFEPALWETLEIRDSVMGWRPVVHFTPKHTDEPVPETKRQRFWYEVRRDRRLRRRMEGQRKRLETLGTEGIRRQVAAAHEAVRLKHRTQRKPPGWRVGDPW